MLRFGLAGVISSRVREPKPGRPRLASIITWWRAAGTRRRGYAGTGENVGSPSFRFTPARLTSLDPFTRTPSLLSLTQAGFMSVEAGTSARSGGLVSADPGFRRRSTDDLDSNGLGTRVIGIHGECGDTYTRVRTAGDVSVCRCAAKHTPPVAYPSYLPVASVIHFAEASARS